MKFEDKLFKQLTKDISLIKSELLEVKSQLKNLTSLDIETYGVKPDYIKKIKKIEKKGKFTSFKTVDDLRKEIENV